MCVYYACVEVSKQLAAVGFLLQHVGPGVSNSGQQVPLPTKPFCWYQKNQSLCRFIHRPPPPPIPEFNSSNSYLHLTTWILRSMERRMW